METLGLPSMATRDFSVSYGMLALPDPSDVQQIIHVET